MYVYVCICMYMYVYVCICMYMYVYVCICMYMYVYVCICMYGPVSRVPESVSLGDHTIGGGQGSGVRTHIYMCVCVCGCWSKNWEILGHIKRTQRNPMGWKTCSPWRNSRLELRYKLGHLPLPYLRVKEIGSFVDCTWCGRISRRLSFHLSHVRQLI